MDFNEMKLPATIFILFIIGCAEKSETRIIGVDYPDGGRSRTIDKRDTISPERGSFESVVDMGELGRKGHTEVFQIVFIKEHETIELPQGFLMLRINFTDDRKLSKAEKVLEDFSRGGFIRNVDISSSSNWSEKEKADFRILKENQPKKDDEFYNHVRFVVWYSEIISGVAQNPKIIYQ